MKGKNNIVNRILLRFFKNVGIAIIWSTGIGIAILILYWFIRFTNAYSISIPYLLILVVLGICVIEAYKTETERNVKNGRSKKGTNKTSKPKKRGKVSNL